MTKKCTNCGNEFSTRWKLIRDEVLCDRCHTGEARSITGRTDVEFSESTLEKSIDKMRGNYG